MSTVISVENLSKKYIIRHVQQQHLLRDVIVNGFRASVRRIARPFSDGRAGSSREEFWALKDVTFDIRRGERVGIIGRNGAGKSTLLKILSRITEPTTGRVKIKGRVASLLEVGTGFNPELTGRENIFLNGAILGMGRAEIKRKFDEIVAFAEVEKFLDTPVKHYSSGMYMRLAFAVAAHLEPEILIVDEVLAVGDAQFQKKCLGKMEEVGKQGRTVLFVSHNMRAVRQLCDRALLLRGGMVCFYGRTEMGIETYLRDDSGMTAVSSREEFIQSLPSDPVFKLETVSLTQQGHEIGETVESGKPLELEIRYEVRERVTGLRVYFELIDEYGDVLLQSFHDEDNDGIPAMNAGRYVSSAIIPSDILGPIRYNIRVLAGIYNVRNCLPPSGVTMAIKVEHTGRTNRAYVGDTFRAKFALPLCWATSKVI